MYPSLRFARDRTALKSKSSRAAAALKNKNKTLIIENQNLASEVISLKNALEESKNQIAPDNKVTPNIENNDYSIKSNLSDLESYFKKDSRLSNKFRSFKQEGRERRLNVS